VHAIDEFGERGLAGFEHRNLGARQPRSASPAMSPAMTIASTTAACPDTPRAEQHGGSTLRLAAWFSALCRMSERALSARTQGETVA